MATQRPGPEPTPEHPERSGPENGDAANPRSAAVLEELTELEDRWRRALAELDNARKRFARDLEHDRAREQARAAAAWLPVLDNLDRAVEQAGDAEDPIAQGIRATRDHAVEVMAGLGYERDTETGIPFDPARHEVVEVVEPRNADPGTVVRVVRPGYGTPHRQLRPAAVAVATRQE